MKEVNSIFDVLGPIMIGPSSSHTAGAARIGKIARYAAQKDIASAKIYLHGSFAETGDGHGTKKAIAAGLLGMEPYDERLRNSIQIMEEKNIPIDFEKKDLEVSHPNTAMIVIKKSTGEIVRVTGSSLGGGAVNVTNINGFEVEITGDYYTIITKHIDVKGLIRDVTNILAEESVNIANMKVIRGYGKKEASMIIETDETVEVGVIYKIKNMKNMIDVFYILPIKENEDV
ncbi:MAG: L-serine ammonia-lyase, iron-sulfur-dependent subunit beta [Bacillota bacterium]|nr:L-serine ammonia-lyase, iron-sulfur-dependent subunit beta [Bacillota bacterium]